MAVVTLYIATSVDGFIADEEGGVDWLESFEDEFAGGEPGGSYEEFVDGVDCLIVGANTYEQILGFGDWPYGNRHTVVVTHRELPRATDQVERYAGPLPTLVSDLRKTHDRIWLVGGATLARAFLDEGLLDELRLSVVPVLVGDGIPLFGPDGVRRALHLADVRAFENGIVELSYAIPSPRV